MKFQPILAAFLLSWSLAQSAHGYNYITCDNGLNLDFGGGYMVFDLANNLSILEKSRINTAFSRLTAFSDANINAVDNNDSNFGPNNQQNEIYMNSIATADCSYWFFETSCVVDEADIRFGNPTWVTGDDSQHAPYTTLATGRSITGAAVHEGAHCLGMAHSNDLYTIMGQEWDYVTRNGVNTYYGPGEDTSDGLIDLHGKSKSNAYPDVGATVFRYDGANGEYSEHRFGVMRNSSGTTILPVVGSYEGQAIYEVSAGQTVRLEYTFENNGYNNTENPNTGHYLSTNSYLSSGDTLLKTGNLTLGRNTPYETVSTVTIPLSTTPGNYYVGVIIDYDNLITEYTNSNNVAYYPISVLPAPPDLIVPFASVNDTTLLPGQSFSTLAITRNDGDGPAAATTLRYKRSTNSFISAGDTTIGTDAINALAAGGQQATNDPDIAPSTEGTWWIGACVDSVSNETVTNNQCSTGTQITVAIQPPVVTTTPVTNILTTTATARGTVNANGGATTLYFDYGTDNLYQFTKNYGSAGSGTTTLVINTQLTGLMCNTSYQVRTRAVNSAGTSIGNVVVFTTEICPGC